MIVGLDGAGSLQHFCYNQAAEWLRFGDKAPAS